MSSSNETNFLDLGCDNLEMIFRRCPVIDRVRLRRVCKDFNDVLVNHCWADIKSFKKTITRDHQCIRFSKLLGYCARYITDLCLRFDEGYLPRILTASVECSKLTTICLRITNIRVHPSDVYLDDAFKNFFKNAHNLSKIFLRGFEISGECFLSLENPDRLICLKFAKCMNLDGDYMKRFLTSTVNLKAFSIWDTKKINRFNRQVLAGLIDSECNLEILNIEGGRASFDKYLISQIFRKSTNLKILYLSRYELTTENISLMPNARELLFERVSYESEKLLHFQSRFSSVRYICLSKCEIDDKMLEFLKCLPNLAALDLIEITFTISDGEKEGSLPNLEKLYMEGCSGVSETVVGEIAKCQNLFELSFRDCGAVGLGRFLQLIKPLTSLRLLDISCVNPRVIPNPDEMTVEGGILLDTIRNMRDLEKLDIFYIECLPIVFLAYLDNLLLYENRNLTLFTDLRIVNIEMYLTNIRFSFAPYNDFVFYEDRCCHYIDL